MARFLANHHHESDPVWHVQIILVLTSLLQLALPQIYVVGPRYLVAIAIIVLAMALSFTTPKQAVFTSVGRRINAIILAATIGLANVYSLGILAGKLLGGGVSNGHDLILAAINIYLTNIVVFALLYWELDSGGPGMRKLTKNHERDFLFPQHSITTPENEPVWLPTFMDYLYVSSTNATAFSPTDTMPLSRRTKMLMLFQSVISLITIALIAGRAVNILK